LDTKAAATSHGIKLTVPESINVDAVQRSSLSCAHDRAPIVRFYGNSLVCRRTANLGSTPAARQRNARPMKPSRARRRSRSMARKKIIGKRLGGEPQDEREHFIQCPACGRWLDMRDLGEVLDHEWTCEGTPITSSSV